MIRVRHGSTAWRLLDLVVRNPGLFSVAELAGMVDQLPGFYRCHPPGQSRAWLDQWRRDRTALVVAREQRAARLMSRLVELGFVERLRPPVVAAWARERLGAEPWTDEAIIAALGAVVRDRTAPSAKGLGAVRCDVLRLVGASPGSRRGLSGARQRAFVDWAAAGVIEAPIKRWPTADGIRAHEEILVAAPVPVASEVARAV